MTRKEIVELLKIVSASYPNAKIADPNTMVTTWEMMFGDLPADKVYKAARLHMENSKFFPTVADIKENLTKADMIYNTSALEAPKHRRKPLVETPKGMTDEEHILGIVEDQMRLECELEGVPFDEDLMKNFLPYEI